MSDKPKRIQLKRTKGWRLPDNAKSVARPSLWGNPYRVGTKISGLPRPLIESGLLGAMPPDTVIDQELAVTAFKNWLKWPEQLPYRILAGNLLKGKDLACWCKPGDPCHGDVLLELANRESEGEG